MTALENPTMEARILGKWYDARIIEKDVGPVGESIVEVDIEKSNGELLVVLIDPSQLRPKELERFSCPQPRRGECPPAVDPGLTKTPTAPPGVGQAKHATAPPSGVVFPWRPDDD